MDGACWTPRDAPQNIFIYDDQSHYVYENKVNSDTMPDEKSDIYVDLT